ncbi:ABC transporter ATP-binding protein [Oceanobacillus piezotolerans]|uniref:Quaternary amine transport ATP-binding protein n=1 Tax=Oceanobacillus piezotolerans TaxID=2448030 RepID=A0A498D7R1_9BACI|nr:ABC transporter ATP-binding protein [Oceanobacillus piezotolerans]RLL44887.1 ABC transporter ATP-binding protein [Oceanobacillus piezotolerans]
MIKLENVTKKYPDGTTAVESLDLEIHNGEFFVLIGPSGCGKTTTLKMMNRLIPLSDGTLYIDGKKISEYNIHELRWNIGYVLQQIALFPHMTIEENIAIVPELKKWSPDKIKERVTELLEMVGLEPNTYRKRKPNELSGGEQQRIGVARALAADPDIILMDEPFSALDPISREKLQDDMLHLKKTINKTIVFVTHDMQEALKLADRICVMQDGKCIQIGTPAELVSNPATDFVKDFVGSKGLPVSTEFTLSDFIQPLPEAEMEPIASLPRTASLEDALQKLSMYELVAITENDQTIGIIDRQIIIQYFSNQLGERGALNG